MPNIADDLKERFDHAAYVYLSAWEYNPETIIEGNVIVRDQSKYEFEDQMIEVFEKLRDSLDGVPSSIIAKAEELRAAAGPEKYEIIVIQAIQNVGYNSFPSTANQFLESLTLSLQFKRAHADSH